VFLPHVAAYYAEALEKGGILSRPDGPEIYADFTSDFARKAFNLGSATRSIALEQVEWQVASEYKVGNHMALPPQADQKLSWRLAEE
jgi:dihydroorotase